MSLVGAHGATSMLSVVQGAEVGVISLVPRDRPTWLILAGAEQSQTWRQREKQT